MQPERDQPQDAPADHQPDVVYGDLRKRNERHRTDALALEARRRRRIALIVEAVRRDRPQSR